MKTNIRISICIALAAIGLTTISSYAQDCSVFFPVKEGSMREMTQFDAKNKVTGYSKQVVKSKETIAGGVKITAESESTDKEKKNPYKGQFTVTCQNGVFQVDMSNMLSGQTMSAYKDMDVTVTSDNLEMPSGLSVGQTLNGGTMTMIVKSSGFQVMKMTVIVSDRKVEAKESVTTKAGTFECYKITYKVMTDMMFKIEGTGTEWVALNVGTVKTESYDKKGKITASSQLTDYKE